MERGEGVAVERLTARLAGPAAPGVDERQARRVWLSTLLAGCDLVPPAMPPSATLVVRQLADPLPGQIARSRHAVRPEPEWEQAVRGALSDLWRRAARPGSGHGVAARGRGPVSAVAVPVPVPEDAEAVFFLDAAELTACLALDLAEGRAHGRWWWRKLLPPEGAAHGGLFLVLSRRPELLPAVCSYLAAWGRAQAVMGALSAPEGLLLALAVSAAYGLPDWRDVAVQPYLPMAGRPPLGDASAAVLPPASPWAPPVAAHLAGLGREQAVCLGLGLTLAGVAPHATAPPVKAEDFSRALAAWWETKDAPNRPPAQEARAAAHTAQTSPRPTRLGSTANPSVQTPPEFASVTPLPDGGAPQVTPASRSAEDALEARPEWPLPVVLPPEGVVTRIGGVLYLINVMRQLGFPEGFPAGIGPWALLEALARAMLPGHDPFAELAADPLWAVMAELDGRQPRTLPGDGLSDQIPFELGPCQSVELSDTLAADLNPALLAWLARAVPFLDRHLQEALQMEEPIPHLLLVPGRLHVTATHVELTTDLERISVPVRMAGLDRDPGWLAPFRRVILFHFV